MLGSLSTKLLSLSVVLLLSGVLIGNGKAALQTKSSSASSSAQLGGSLVKPLSVRRANDRPVTCDAYPLQQCLTP